MIGTPIAFGLTMIVLLTLFYYYWRIRQLRARLLAFQAAPVLEGLPIEFGIGKNVVETFPTIRACELKCTATEDLQCPICLVEYEEWEVLRQLPFCGHIFHTLCVGAWFEKQTTCPVCRMSMSEIADLLDSCPLAAENTRCRVIASPEVAVEVTAENSPSWIMVNRLLPVPAPPTLAGMTERALDQDSPPSLDSNENMEVKRMDDSMRGCESIQFDSQEVKGFCSSDIDVHVVNMSMEEWASRCQCKRPTWTNSPSSEDSRREITESQEMDVLRDIRESNVSALTDVQGVRIQISQSIVQLESVDLNVCTSADDQEKLEAENLNSGGILRTQETCGVEDPSQCKLTSVEAYSANAGCCNLSGGAKCSGDADEMMADSPQGIFEFQPIITSDGGWTLGVTTESETSPSTPL